MHSDKGLHIAHSGTEKVHRVFIKQKYFGQILQKRGLVRVLSIRKSLFQKMFIIVNSIVNKNVSDDWEIERIIQIPGALDLTKIRNGRVGSALEFNFEATIWI